MGLIKEYMTTLEDVYPYIKDSYDNPKVGEYAMKLVMSGVSRTIRLETLRSVFNGDEGLNF